MDWEKELPIAHLVKQKIAEVDFEHLWENTSPGFAASEDQLQALEARLGFVLAPQYRAFLLHANGWRAFMQHVDLFGTEDLEGGRRLERAVALIDSLEPLAPSADLAKTTSYPLRFLQMISM
jgi:SMI1 / KNR4 family (SUKH-1)